MRNHTAATASILTIAAIAQTAAAQQSDYIQSVVINEVMSENTSTIFNSELGEYSDWIELYNGGNETFDLSGYFLTDKMHETTKYEIPQGITIEPGGYLLFWADGHPELGPLHTNFRIDNDGESAAIFSPINQGNERVDAISVPALGPNSSWGRSCDGFIGLRSFTDEPIQEVPSPLAANTGHCTLICGFADFNQDTRMNYFDVIILINAFIANDPLADVNDDGDINFFDLSAFLASYNRGCHGE